MKGGIVKMGLIGTIGPIVELGRGDTRALDVGRS